ncbi:MAG: CpaF family protein [Lachnospiraceae bacterium]|nr:CpaF family protein [Lachnospiraceae bacterium]
MNERGDETWKELKAVVLEELNFYDEVTDELVLEVIDRVLKTSRYSKSISLNRRCLLRLELFHSIRRLDILEELLADDTITEIMINGERGIFLERQGKLEAFSGERISKEQLEELVVKITGMSNRMINEASPLADARLGDGSRVSVAVSPVALDTPAITIRKFPKRAVTLKDLLEWESFNEEIAEFLKKVVIAKYNIFVSGSTGSGKTTLLNVLSDFIPKNERIITIEDTAELQIRNVPNLVRLESRNSVVEGCREITIRDLLRASLRHRPDRVIVGEVRGAETVDMLQAFCTGHDGSLSTGHGNSTKDMLYRLETMVMMGMDIPALAVRRQLASGIDLMIHLGRLRDKRRVLLEISEIDGCENGEIIVNPLYRFQEKQTAENGKVQGEWVKVGELHHKEKLLMAGISDD